MTQPKALYLADVLEHKAIHENGTMLEMSCAAELRRLHAELEWCRQVCAATAEGWRVERDALLEALKEIVDAADGTGWDQLDASFSRARAAIKAAEGEKE